MDETAGAEVEPLDPKPASGLRRRRIKALAVVGVLIALISFRSSFADWNDVPAGSMHPTILVGDRVFVDKLAYDLKIPFITTGHRGGFNLFGLSLLAGGPTVTIVRWADPRRGDIVVFWSPRDNKRMVKRVVAVPGDELSVERQRLIVNGRPAAYAPIDDESLRRAGMEDAPREIFALETVEGRTHLVMAETTESPRATFGPVTIPPERYFVMGDHRNDSLDSRFFGMVERKRIVGRAVGVVASFDVKQGWRPRRQRFFSSLR